MKSITCLLSALAAGVAAIDMGPTYGKDYGGQGTPVRRLSNYQLLLYSHAPYVCSTTKLSSDRWMANLFRLR